MVVAYKPDWTFYLNWIVLTAFCVPLAFVFNLLILGILTSIIGDFIYIGGVQRITEDYLGMLTLIPLAGLLSGLVQYALLRRYLPSMGRWAPATFVGWLLGLLLILVSGQLMSWTYATIDLAAALTLLGLCIGLAQWVLLRQRIPRAGWWVGANALGWVLSGWIAGNSLAEGGFFALGFFPACATAALLAWLLNQARPGDLQGA